MQNNQGFLSCLWFFGRALRPTPPWPSSAAVPPSPAMREPHARPQRRPGQRHDRRAGESPPSLRRLLVQPDTDRVFDDAALGLSFRGRYASITLRHRAECTSLYLGEGTRLRGGSLDLSSAPGASTAALVDLPPPHAHRRRRGTAPIPRRPTASFLATVNPPPDLLGPRPPPYHDFPSAPRSPRFAPPHRHPHSSLRRERSPRLPHPPANRLLSAYPPSRKTAYPKTSYLRAPRGTSAPVRSGPTADGNTPPIRTVPAWSPSPGDACPTARGPSLPSPATDARKT